MTRIALPISLLTGLAIWMFAEANTFPAVAFQGSLQQAGTATSDTLPPVEERYNDFITNPNTNPFDLKDPSVVEQTVDYDPETGQYIIQEKIGDDYFRPPTYMTFEEYLAWQRKKEEREYFNQLAGINTGEGATALDPLAKFDVKSSMLDRLFGGSTVDIRPQGGIDLTFGVDFQRLDNPILTERQRRTGGFDFDMNIQMNVTGKIGEKLTLTTNYNNNATFNFDNQIKLDYNSDLFSEDDIIKKIEAGNVSLPLRGSLIQGAQSLFGLKTELQFGHLRLTAIASQQNSQNENIQLKGGSQVQEFEVKADEYDENRHFFLSHYNRDGFERNLRNLPQINTLFHLENIEVWITNDRNVVEDVRDIVAFADLGEPERLVNPSAIPPFPTPPYREIGNGRPLPDNNANSLYQRLLDRPDLRSIDRSVSILQSQEFGLSQSKDFEKVSARKLDEREYTVHPDLGYISVNINVQPDQVLAVAYQYKYNGNIYKVGELSVNTDAVGPDTSDLTPQVLYVKMLKSTTQRTDVPTWDLMMKNVYSIGAFQVNREDFKLDIFYEDPGKGFKRFLPKSNLEGKPLIRVFNLDNLNTQGDPQPDGVFDFVPGVTINPTNGRIMFPVLEPFGTGLGNQITDANFRDSFVYQELYDLTLFQAQEFPEKNRYAIRGSFKSSASSEISLGAFNIPPGSVRVTAGGQLLQEGRDYEVDYGTGRVKILNDAIIASGVPVNVSFEDNTVFGFQTKAMIGVRADYKINDNLNVGATFLQLFERPFTQKVNIGDDPIRNRIYGFDLNLSKEAPWLTKAVDKLPFFSTKATSNINFSAEAAYLQPGHSKAINESKKDKSGVVYIDDFEGSTSSFDLRQPTNQWFLASVPQNDDQNNNPLFPEANASSLAYGANRARMNWYRIDNIARVGD
ncbi:MAG: cell surface protein SprA, partial [Saprospiraceae bacterium]|nr:cell surface protein SprA [Saprospiraceae bacterium]